MPALQFTVDSALLRELGERLVGKPHIALAELIKNSYDADASCVPPIFVRSADDLVLGDFGLVFVPERPPRITASLETVGAGDFIPPWGDLGAGLEHVETNFDVYMLGKVLWCMVSGRSVLKREYFNEPENDLTLIFKDDPHVYLINQILSHCVVERKVNCYASALDLLMNVDACLSVIERGGQLLRDGIPRPCHVCGIGQYTRRELQPGTPVYKLRLWNSGGATDISLIDVEVFECGYCGHVQLFRAGLLPRPTGT